ncbi:LPS export ABC transporter periplasmic protein LptC [Thalassotalea profundi]|uniref:Lipopolysaccharide export system protein LptC n=1 Tax=Thalassotalea profundi TaxID=2036687 RepID=A0ABQ3IVD6_9GAMM|nr:LPS export ABC transporter periplasmic protein LptC [Thalassotalea profundi]GHE93136.1 lipopolysaccharide export system protein LptC [Thalassotalea profundi]
MTRLTGFAVSFFIIAIASYGVVEWLQAQTKTEQVITDAMTPDFIAESLNSDIYNASGDLTYIINAQRMEHYSALSVTHFEFPKYTLYTKNSETPWKLNANEGTLYSNNRVRLENRVTLTATDQSSLIQKIHGRYLELDLNTNIISTEQTIMIEGKDFTIYGSGLIVDLNTKQMTLTEHVQTIFKSI